MMHLEGKGIQYIQKRNFKDFPNTTVSLCNYIIYLIASYPDHYGNGGNDLMIIE